MTKDNQPITSPRRSQDWQPRQNSKHADQSKKTAVSSSNKILGQLELKKSHDAPDWLLSLPVERGGSKGTSNSPLAHASCSTTPSRADGNRLLASPNSLRAAQVPATLAAISTSKGHVSSEPSSASARHGSPEPGQCPVSQFHGNGYWQG